MITDPITDPFGDDAGPRCAWCDELTMLTDSNGDPQCAACAEQDEEAAHERQLSAYYGAGTPVTQDEQHAAAWAQRKAVR